MKPAEFRKELLRVMPGYSWTVHKPLCSESTYMEATGIQSSGFNRMSTLRVVRRQKEGYAVYEVKSSGFGRHASWLSEQSNVTLASALRDLQNHYEHMASTYARHASDLKGGRTAPKEEPCSSK